MRTKGGLEDVKCLGFSSYCGDQRSFLFLFGRHLGIILFPLPLTPADWIGNVWPNRHGAANNLVLLVLRQYIGAANLLAPIYWRCKHLKNLRNFLSCKMSLCLRLLVLPAQVGATMFVAPIYWCYLCWQHQYQPIQLCLPRGKVYSFWRIFSPCFLHGDWYGSTPTPSPVSKGRDQWELRGGTLFTYIFVVIWLHSHPLPRQ